jgi:hypothetical protein
MLGASAPRGALLLLAAAWLGCAERPASDGSTRQERSWPAEARPGPDLDLRSVADEPLAPDTLSVTVMAESAGDELLSLAVRGPTGWLVDPQRPEESPNRVLRGRGRVVAVLPAATAALPLASNYQVAPVSLSGAPVAATVSTWIKRGPGTRQELPLAVVLAGVELEASALDRALGEVGRVWRAAGVEVREPARVSIEGPAAAAVARVEVDGALGNDSPMVAAALALSAQAPADALVLVVVPDIALGGPGYPIWALSGGIPVPPVSGTGRSGVVVSAVLLQRDPLLAGQVMAHELGHALGLFHTTEADLVAGAAVTDQIDDTPACPASADRPPGDDTLTAAECDRFDAANLMFWSVTRGATVITAGQAGLARRSPLTR